MKRQADPVIVSADGSRPSVSLAPRPYSVDSSYDEAWIQEVIHENPAVLPIRSIEPGFDPPISVCRELPLSTGNADNLLITPSGDLILVECKLWRNPQARREVIAQIIDYARALSTLSYDDLEKSVQQANGGLKVALYSLIDPSMGEADFVDSVEHNLATGKILLIIAGDGITEAAEELVDYLQRHVGLQFRLALVQLRVYDLPNGDRLVVPSVPLATRTIVRGVVVVDDRRAEITEPPDDARSRRATTLSEEEHFARLDALVPGTSGKLAALVEKGEDIGVSLEARKTLMIRVTAGERYANAVVVSENGDADTSYVWWLAQEGVPEAHLARYQEAVAAAVPGAAFHRTPKGGYVKRAGRTLKIWDLLDHTDAWLAAAASLRETMTDVARSTSDGA